MRRNLNQSAGGKRICGTPAVGVLGSLIPSTGDHGGGYVYNDLTLPEDADKEICGRITSWPSAGTLFAYEDTSFEFSGAPDGTYYFDYQLYVDGVAVGSPVTVTLQVGPVVHAAMGGLSTASAAMTGTADRSVTYTIHSASGALLATGAQVSGNASRIAAPVIHSAMAALVAQNAQFSAAAMRMAEDSWYVSAVTRYVIAAEDRAYMISSEDHTYTIAAENKTYTVEANL